MKMGKAMDGGGLGRNKRGKTKGEGERRSQFCVTGIDQDA